MAYQPCVLKSGGRSAYLADDHNASLRALYERPRLAFLFSPPQTWKGGES
jgi:hypothetical protein